MKKITALLMLPFLTACLIVDDFRATWDEAQPDMCITKLAAAFYEKSFKKSQSDYSQLIRPLSLGGAHFVMIKEHASDTGGHIYPFFVESGVLVTKRGNPTHLDYAKEEYGKQGISIKESTVTVKSLDNASKALLEQAYHDDRLWEEDLKMLYNKALSDACRFEDRDLEKER